MPPLSPLETDGKGKPDPPGCPARKVSNCQRFMALSASPAAADFKPLFRPIPGSARPAVQPGDPAFMLAAHGRKALEHVRIVPGNDELRRVGQAVNARVAFQ